VLADPKGVGQFPRFRSLPHVIDSNLGDNRDEFLKTLRVMLKEVKRRQKLMVDTMSTDYRDFRAKSNDHLLGPLTRVILIIEEATEFIPGAHPSKANAEIQNIIGILLRVGRAMGFHVILSSQVASTIPPAWLQQLRTRITFRVEAQDSSRITVGNADAALLLKSPGEAIYNMGGDASTNRFIKVPHLDDSVMVTRINSIKEFYSTTTPIKIFAQPNLPLDGLADSLPT
jgi:DNA segregation ATPase FtsK/SpoIIIE-like protein